MTSLTIREIPAAELDALTPALSGILHACILGGASVGFILPFTEGEAAAFWQGLRPGLETGGRRLLGAWLGNRLVGTVQLLLAGPPNGRHRAEVAKMLVHPDARQRGIGRALMTAVEALARTEGRTLLLLDTGSDEGRALYRSVGFQTVGDIPGYAIHVDGSALATTILYKHLTESTTGNYGA
ncbi:GNAT family N-acetyltransferase [Nitrospirillum pindoramense]|uniref:Acetyltransferase (GNAT) family protein n=1 Tax=Nitrospirillum amazonense TaxID=28077 RepID=A0A560HFD6_9PROT|nr:GNAT family N-acetyltransferase [Nitrospirillum amazonense]TWB45138.1 acetyltransferase (GNAT) family protein [Nitrospirillum amazonense]